MKEYAFYTFERLAFPRVLRCEVYAATMAEAR